NRVLRTNATGTNVDWVDLPTPTIPTGTNGDIFFSNGSGELIHHSANLFWATTNLRLGIGTTTPTSTLHTGGSFSTSILTTTTDITLDNTHHTIIIGGDLAITLPDADSCEGRIYIIKNMPGFTTTISEYMDSDGVITPGSMTLEIGVTQLQSDGTIWQQIN